MGDRRTNEEVLGVDVAVLWKVEVLLGHEYALTEEVLHDVSLRVRWGRELGLSSWIFLRSAFGMSIAASLWRYSGDRTQCRGSG